MYRQSSSSKLAVPVVFYQEQNAFIFWQIRTHREIFLWQYLHLSGWILISYVLLIVGSTISCWLHWAQSDFKTLKDSSSLITAGCLDRYLWMHFAPTCWPVHFKELGCLHPGLHPCCTSAHMSVVSSFLQDPVFRKCILGLFPYCCNSLICRLTMGLNLWTSAELYRSDASESQISDEGCSNLLICFINSASNIAANLGWNNKSETTRLLSELIGSKLPATPWHTIRSWLLAF